MKKLIPWLALLVILPVVAQDADKLAKPNDEVVGEVATDQILGHRGLVLKVEPNRINIDETWVPLTQPESNVVNPLVVVNEMGQEISYSKLIAPFLANITYTVKNDKTILLRIQVLEQYEFNEDGYIKK